MKIKSRLDNTEICIEMKEGSRYGIMLSGGIDSAVLLYLLLLECEETNITPTITLFTIPKHDGSLTYINGIVQYMNNRFNITLPDTITVGNPDAHHTKQSTTAYFDIKIKYPEIEYIFFGTNKIPPTTVAGLAPVRVNANTEMVIAPFFDLYKTHIIDLLFQYEMEGLLKLTHTCTEQVIGRCNKCWQCGERAWAFNIMGRKDTGIN